MKEPLLSICHVSEGTLLASQKRKALSSLKDGLETGKTQREGAVFMPRWKSPSIRLISYSLPHTQICNCVCFISQVLGVGKEFSMWVLVCVCVFFWFCLFYLLLYFLPSVSMTYNTHLKINRQLRQKKRYLFFVVMKNFWCPFCKMTEQWWRQEEDSTTVQSWTSSSALYWKAPHMIHEDPSLESTQGTLCFQSQ